MSREIWQAVADACDPNKTKALLIGEFETNTPEGDTVDVTWTAVKEIQAAIFEQIKLNAGWRCSGCGSHRHILELIDQGYVTCCPDRSLELLEGGDDEN